jgi:hypothetical protein
MAVTTATSHWKLGLFVVVSLLTASNRAQEIYSQLDQLNTNQRNQETKLRQLEEEEKKRPAKGKNGAKD